MNPLMINVLSTDVLLNTGLDDFGYNRTICNGRAISQ